VQVKKSTERKGRLVGGGHGGGGKNGGETLCTEKRLWEPRGGKITKYPKAGERGDR